MNVPQILLQQIVAGAPALHRHIQQRLKTTQLAVGDFVIQLIMGDLHEEADPISLTKQEIVLHEPETTPLSSSHENNSLSHRK